MPKLYKKQYRLYSLDYDTHIMQGTNWLSLWFDEEFLDAEMKKHPAHLNPHWKVQYVEVNVHV